MKYNKSKTLFFALAVLLTGCSTEDKISSPSSNGESSNEKQSDVIRPSTDKGTADITTTDTSKETKLPDTGKISETTPITDKVTDKKDTEKDTSGNEYNWTIPSYYQSSIDLTLRNAELKTNLHNIIESHTSIGYKALYNAYLKTDLREDGTIWDMYSNVKFKPSENSGNYKKEGDMYNREHTIPQSIFSEKDPMKCDLFHVYPTDGYVNNRRSNFPHAEVGSTTYVSSNNTKVGSSKTSGVSGSVCEPADEYKGDFARTYFYFVTCYQTKLAGFKNFAAFSNNTYPSLSSWAIKLYLKWSKEDPVSEKEIKRNEEAYKIQKNRNPFIDFPGIENLIW